MRRLVGVAIVSAPIAAFVAAMAACDPDTTRVGAGGECFVATDCEPGLVCVPQRNGARICSSDITEIAGEGPPEGGTPEAAPPTEAGTEDGPVTPMDSGTQDTGVADTGAADTGSD